MPTKHYLIVQRARMVGFLVLDYMPRAAEAIGALAGWMQAGKIKNKVDVQHGLENAPGTLRRLFEGRNQGKQLLRHRHVNEFGAAERLNGRHVDLP
jgi:NADPH-dependent curcumin reductase CurA